MRLRKEQFEKYCKQAGFPDWYLKAEFMLTDRQFKLLKKDPKKIEFTAMPYYKNVTILKFLCYRVFRCQIVDLMEF